MAKKSKIRIGITVGDLNGIGYEVIMKTFRDNRVYENMTPIVYGSSKSASFHIKVLNLNDFSFNIIDKVEDAVPNKPNLLNCWSDEVKMELGKPNHDSGKFALKSLELATEDLASNKIDVLVTAPVSKENLKKQGFEFPGHTEYLASYSNVDDHLMLMVSENLKVGVVTGHIPLKEVAENISREKILSKINILDNSLRKDFGVLRPKIAILGLNPHAGESGEIGEEDQKIVKPAVQQAMKEGYLVYGPYAADGFFGSSAFKDFDGVLAMYHDQGLVPFKALSFGMGVNYTAGLPIVRTSPDHGTGFEIAGKDMAYPDSFRQALFMAKDIYNCRKDIKEITSNPLQAQSQSREVSTAASE